MNLPLRTLVLILVATTAGPAVAQVSSAAPPEPIPMGTPYFYQVGNPYWYQPLTYYPTPFYTYPSPFPFGSIRPVFGLYSWDYGVYYPYTVGWYPATIVTAQPVGWYSTTAVTYPIASSYYPTFVGYYSPGGWYPSAVWPSPYVYQTVATGRVWLGAW